MRKQHAAEHRDDLHGDIGKRFVRAQFTTQREHQRHRRVEVRA